MADARGHPNATWERLVAQLGRTPEDRRNIQVLRGFLDGLHQRNPELVNGLLDNALQNETLASLYPALQGSVSVNDQGLGRLMASLELGKAPVRIMGTWRGAGSGSQSPRRIIRN